MGDEDSILEEEVIDTPTAFEDRVVDGESKPYEYGSSNDAEDYVSCEESEDEEQSDEDYLTDSEVEVESDNEDCILKWNASQAAISDGEKDNYLVPFIDAEWNEPALRESVLACNSCPEQKAKFNVLQFYRGTLRGPNH